MDFALRVRVRLTRGTSMPSEKKRILIVDDEEDITWSISKKLKNQHFLEVHCAKSGQGALDLLEGCA